MKKLSLLALLLMMTVLLTACFGADLDTSGDVSGQDETSDNSYVQGNSVDGSIWFGEDDSSDDSGSTSTTGKTDKTTGKTDKSTTKTTDKTTKKPAVSTAKPTKDARIVLPGKGTDLDGKGRIVIDKISAKGRKVTITFKNISSKKTGGEYITEETMEVYYKCYSKDGKELTSKAEYFGTLYPGCIEVGETSEELTFTVPAGTREVKITGAKIVYWTPWS